MPCIHAAFENETAELVLQHLYTLTAHHSCTTWQTARKAAKDQSPPLLAHESNLSLIFFFFQSPTMLLTVRSN